jgi:hypothetical protein
MKATKIFSGILWLFVMLLFVATPGLSQAQSWQWNTFLGSSGEDVGTSIAVDGNGNVYVVGYSAATWGAPVSAYVGGYDVFTAKLNDSGALQWNTFLGSSSNDVSYSIAVDGSGNVYVAGESGANWGSPTNAHAGGIDALVAKLDNSGALQWHTFLGSSDYDNGHSIAVDGNGNVYLTGESYASWDSPVSSYAGDSDAFAAKLDNSGLLQWNTFLGSSNTDYGHSIAVDGSDNVYVAGPSNDTWGAPVNAYAGGPDVFAAKLNNSGVLQGNTFLGSASSDEGNGIAVDGNGNVYLTGGSNGTWGEPVNTHAGASDGFVAKFGPGDVVPVELFGFSATSRGHSITLNWTTATEKDNYGFEVQRKNQPNGDWKKIGSVMGNGTTATPHNYSFVDDHIAVGAYSYRLKQIDFDGGFEFTGEILIEVKPPSTFSLDQNYPNPFNPRTTIKFDIPEKSHVKLEIYNLLGEKIRTLISGRKDAGIYNIEWDGKNKQGITMSSGIYLYILTTDKHRDVRKMILTK